MRGVYNNQDVEAINMGTVRATDKRKCLIHLLTGQYYSGIQMNDIMPCPASWMDLEMVILCEGSQRRRRILGDDLWVEYKNRFHWTHFEIENKKRPQDTGDNLLDSKKKRWGLRWEKEEAGLHECRVIDMKSELARTYSCTRVSHRPSVILMWEKDALDSRFMDLCNWILLL